MRVTIDNSGMNSEGHVHFHVETDEALKEANDRIEALEVTVSTLIQEVERLERNLMAVRASL